jgi:hypothetical protein
MLWGYRPEDPLVEVRRYGRKVYAFAMTEDGPLPARMMTAAEVRRLTRRVAAVKDAA